MRLCFVVEERYRNAAMPLAVACRLARWGHQVDLLEPQRSITRISELVGEGDHDAWVLKTVSDGPGLSLLEAAAASGLRTINDARAIRPVRDKAVAAAVARRCGLPVPLTYFAAVPTLLRQVPAEHYPLVVKPAQGSAGRSVRLIRTPEELAAAEAGLAGEGFLLAQPYVANPGVDLKVYVVGGEMDATLRPSPLHPEVRLAGRQIPMPPGLAALVAKVGAVFGLDLYGVDVVRGHEGWVVVDVNDFPSFHHVPDAVTRVARSILELAGPRSRSRHRLAGPAAAVTAVPRS